MKILLRSCFVANPQDKQQLLLRNIHLLDESGLGFQAMEDIAVWSLIRSFVQSHNHPPDILTLNDHFRRNNELEVVTRLQILTNLSALTQGDFLSRLETKINDRKQVLWEEALRTSGQITSLGMEVKDPKGNKKILKGAMDSARHILEVAHTVLTPSQGGPGGGDVTTDGVGFMERYLRVESDPLAGIGQFTGVAQMDEGLKGAKRNELWLHAAFTGGLKCVAGDTRIFDQDTGTLRTVKEIYESRRAPKVHAWDPNNGEIVQAQGSCIVESGVREILKVSTKAGRSIRVSGNHPFLGPLGWVNASDLQVGDWVAVPARLPNETVSAFSDHEVALLGYMLGDGCFADQLGFTNGSPEVIQDFLGHLHGLGYSRSENTKVKGDATYRVYPQETCTEIKISRSKGDKHHPQTSPLRILTERLGLYGCRSADKFIPGALWQITDQQVWILLSKLWATEGRVDCESPLGGRKPKTVLWYGTRSFQLATDIQMLLQRVGVPSTVMESHPCYKGKPRPFWTVLITSVCGKRHFLLHTDITGKSSVSKRALAVLPEKDNTDWVPPTILSSIEDSVRAPARRGGWHYARGAKKKTRIARDTAIRLHKASEGTSNPRLHPDIRWDRVTKVSREGTEMTYDLSVPGPKNFVANGFITHNSTLALNWAYNQAVYYLHSCAYFSLEMPYVQVRAILYAMHTAHEKFKGIRHALGIQKDPDATVGLDYEKIRDGMLNVVEKQFLLDHVVPDFNDPANNYGKIHIEIADPDKTDFTVADLRMKAELIYSRNPFSTIFVDHAGLMDPRKWVASTTERQNEVLRDLKKLSMAFNRGQGIAMVVLYQINREGMKRVLKVKEREENRTKDGKTVSTPEGPGVIFQLTDLSYANEAERSSDIVTASYVDDSLRERNMVMLQNLKARDTRPFTPFYARVEWPCRRIYSLFDIDLLGVEKLKPDIDSISESLK